MACGFPLPNTTHVSDQPEHQALAAGAADTVNADWADASRAEHYRIEGQIVGEDTDFVLLFSRDESDAMEIVVP